MRSPCCRWAGPFLAFLVLASVATADEDSPAAKPKKQTLIDPPEIALRKFTVAPGLKVDSFAAEPDVRNPVSLSIDEHGRVFVVESDRRRSSVIDIRWHQEWLDADLSFRTVEDRRDFLKREIVPGNKAVLDRLTKPGQGGFMDFNKDGVLDWRDLEVQTERIRLLEDTDGDGRADRVRVFADGFTNIIAGVAAGVLARRGEVYFACIPDLWKMTNAELRVPNGTSGGLSTIRPGLRQSSIDIRPLISGFGVHIAFGGHDMHGLIFGPDGKLYWSIADRGTDTNLFARIKDPWPGLTPDLLADSGCVFRANPDGSDFEVVACGLRNPQELAFDEFGNLFTADNNADAGDKARWHYVVEGADFGWRIGWQWLEARAYQPKLGAWNGERLWHLANSNTAAYLIPALAHIGHGPAGLAFNPGTGLPSQFDRHFFLCDFPGSVLMWTNIPDGASFKIGPVKNLFGELGPTDVAFGVEGGVYVTDWFKSFDKSDKGRIYRIHDPATDASAAVQETKRLLADGMEKRGVKEIMELLGHADMRVRLEAQRHLSENGRYEALCAVATNASLPQIARLHAIWGLGPMIRRSGSLSEAEQLDELNSIFSHLALQEPEFLVHAIHFRWGGYGRTTRQISARQWSGLSDYLTSPNPRVRIAALNGLGALRARPAIGQVLDVLAKNEDKDPYVRHAGVLALARFDTTNSLVAFAFPGSNGNWRVPGATMGGDVPKVAAPRPVRLGVLLALRRLGSPEVARFLSDPDPQIVLEAARAIHDVPIPDAMPALAAWLLDPKSQISNLKSEIPQFTLRRALNANFRLGQTTNAVALAEFAARADAPEPLRIESLELLAAWPKPSGRDHFTGLWRPLPSRDAALAANALRDRLTTLLATPPPVKLAVLRAAAALEIKELDLPGLVTNTEEAPEVRIEALKSLARLKDARYASALQSALTDKNEGLRIEAGRLQGSSAGANEKWSKVLETGSLLEKQAALASLANDPGERADELLSKQLDALLAGKLPAELHLDLLDAAGNRKKNAGLAKKLAQYDASLPKDDPLAVYRPALRGGDSEKGRKNFIDNQQIACFRCHKIQGEGGDVGPELAGIGARQSREYILESIVFPNKQVATGFENVLVDLKSGASYAGVVKSETDTELVLNSPEDGLLTLKKADLKNRQRGLSAMPEQLAGVLTRNDLRDLVEFLATLK